MLIREKHSLCLNAGTIKQASLERQIEIAGDCGFDGLGLWIDDIQATVQRGLTLEDISRMMEEADVTATELCFISLCQHAGQANFSSVLARTREVFQIAHGLGCNIIIGVPAMTDEVADITADGLRQIGELACAYDVRLALEFPGNAYTVSNLATAWQLVKEAESTAIGLVLDTFHFFLGNSRKEDLAALPIEKIFLVHVSDAMDMSRARLCTHHDYRTFPGEGIIDYDPIFEQLSKKNYRGAFSMEIWNQSFLKQDPAEVAGKGYASLKALVERIST